MIFMLNIQVFFVTLHPKQIIRDAYYIFLNISIYPSRNSYDIKRTYNTHPKYRCVLPVGSREKHLFIYGTITKKI